MKAAPKWGDVLHPDEDRAPRLQTESPNKSSSCKAGYKARSLEVQRSNTVRVPPVGDHSRPITNGGHARSCIRAMCRMIEADHGPSGCRGPEQRDYFVAMAWLEDTASAADPNYRRTLPKLALRYFPGLSIVDQEDARAEVRELPYQVTTRSLGELMGLTYERREQFGFRHAEPIGMTMADVEREKDRRRKEQTRREQGIPARGERYAQAKLLDPDAPRSTIYDRVKHNRVARKRVRSGCGELDATSGYGGYQHP